MGLLTFEKQNTLPLPWRTSFWRSEYIHLLYHFLPDWLKSKTFWSVWGSFRSLPLKSCCSIKSLQHSCWFPCYQHWKEKNEGREHTDWCSDLFGHMCETCRGTLAGSMGGNKLLRYPREFIFHLQSTIRDAFALESPGTMLHYVTGNTEDKERRPMTTYSYKNKCNNHNRDKTSLDSN